MKIYYVFMLMSAIFAVVAAWEPHLGGILSNANFAGIAIAWAVLSVAAVLEELLKILRRLDSREHK